MALTTLKQVTEQGQSLSSLVPLAESQLPAKEIPLYRKLVYGICRWYVQLDAIARELLEHPLRRRDHNTRLLILLGLYQLMHTRVPAHAAIHETVELAAQFHAANRKNLINAILRAYLREQDALSENLHESPAYQFSHPDWMIAKLKANWPDQAESTLLANNTKAPLTLRVNRMKTNRDELASRFEQAGVESFPCTHSTYGLRLAESLDIRQLPGFEEGLFSVQDEAAQLCTQLLDLDDSNLSVLDACAAPGGKTTAILEATNNQAQVVALELNPARMKRVEENLRRLGLTADLSIGDATNREWWDGTQFDRILVDAPCSATGVIRKHPDIKLLRKEDDITTLANTQLTILETLWPTLKPGGTLVYATCSVLNQENTRVIERFVKSQTDATIIPIEAEWGVMTNAGRQLFPKENAHDGFFYAKLKKGV